MNPNLSKDPYIWYQNLRFSLLINITKTLANFLLPENQNSSRMEMTATFKKWNHFWRMAEISIFINIESKLKWKGHGGYINWKRTATISNAYVNGILSVLHYRRFQRPWTINDMFILNFLSTNVCVHCKTTCTQVYVQYSDQSCWFAYYSDILIVFPLLARWMSA